jgi:hypothetical protein
MQQPKPTIEAVKSAVIADRDHVVVKQLDDVTQLR